MKAFRQVLGLTIYKASAVLLMNLLRTEQPFSQFNSYLLILSFRHLKLDTYGRKRPKLYLILKTSAFTTECSTVLSLEEATQHAVGCLGLWSGYRPVLKIVRITSLL